MLMQVLEQKCQRRKIAASFTFQQAFLLVNVQINEWSHVIIFFSPQCFDALSTRQRLISSDVKVDKQLIKNCRNAIFERNCHPIAGSIEQTLSSLLLCLESDSDQDDGCKYTAAYWIPTFRMEIYTKNILLIDSKQGRNWELETNSECDPCAKLCLILEWKYLPDRTAEHVDCSDPVWPRYDEKMV